MFNKGIFSIALGFLLGQALTFCLCADLAEKNQSPEMDSKISNSAQWLEWSKKEIVEIQNGKTNPEKSLNVLNQAINVLNSCNAEVALKNTRHFADLQELRMEELELLYCKSIWLIENKAEVNLMLKCLNEMSVKKSPAEDMLPLLLASGEVSKYLENLRKVFEKLERHPEALKRPVIVPPIFEKISTWNAEDCHNAFVVLDIVLKQNWRPTPTQLESVLLPISKQYENLKLDRFALDILNLAQEKGRSEHLDKAIENISRKVQAMDAQSPTQRDLY